MWDGFEFHPSADLAVARFPADKVPPFVDALPVYFNKLNRGNGVSSFGFPFSGAREVRGQRLGITVEEIFFKGHVATLYDRDQLESLIPRAFRVSYGLSFESPMGLSGAPLLALVDGVFHVVGIVYENRTVEFQVDEYHEVDGENGKQRPVLVKRVHNIGLAGAAIDLTDLVAFAGVSA